jgi:prophage maintenance system killer protein
VKSQIEIYKSIDGQAEVNVQFESDTIWLNRHQMAVLFDRDVKTIGKHIGNIFSEKELMKESTVAKFATVQLEGNREVERDIEHYNLDVIISVGYRVNSKQGTQFRIWATSKLKELLIEGYSVNKKRLEQKEQEVRVLKSGIQILSKAVEEKFDGENNWLKLFANGLSLLDDYDHENLDGKGISENESTYPALEEYQTLIQKMKAEFNSAVFGKEKDKSFTSSIAQIEKGIDSKDFYPTIEEKAAMLLYLVTKNHSFVDGNKRIAAACFLLFLKKNEILFKEEKAIISNEALASLTLFVASSKPEERETVTKLIISVLNRNQ